MWLILVETNDLNGCPIAVAPNQSMANEWVENRVSSSKGDSLLNYEIKFVPYIFSN